MPYATNANTYRALYHGAAHSNPLWNQIVTTTGQVYAWDDSSYIAKPPFLDDFELIAPGISPVSGARALAIWGDSITTDHISPAGPIPQDSPAGAYLLAHGVAVGDFNSYGSRRGNHEVMVRGTFANVRIRNLMSVPQPDGQPTEGGVTRYQPSGEAMSIHAAALRYQGAGVPTLVFAGADYGSGSSRDWAAKGTRLLGVRAVIAKSIERIHRSNLVGMGVVPLQFLPQDSVQSLGLRGDELFDLPGLDGDLQPQQELTLHVRRSDGSRFVVPLLLRVDTPIELEYLKHGGVVPYVLRDLLTRTRA